MNISLKLHFPKNLFNRIYTCQNLHLAEISPKAYFPEITFPRKFIFLETIFHSKIYNLFMLFISNKQKKLLVEIKKRSDNSYLTDWEI